ncbi:MAG TPA: DUF3124 domain-containing protein [Rhodocyclaceae bacterium]|nr:DUF3124 domain-containing protein [Rhodocyclaceae bacterium]
MMKFAALFSRLHSGVNKGASTALLICGLAVAGAPLHAQEAAPLSSGQTLYLPIYSHLYHGDPDRSGKPEETLTSAHVSIRNTDSAGSLRVTSARYYDTAGKLLKEYVPAPRTVGPLGTLELFVPRADVAGGSGANFIITWSAESAVNPPLVEALHADVRASRGIVFITTARPVKPR